MTFTEFAGPDFIREKGAKPARKSSEPAAEQKDSQDQATAEATSQEKK